jgi:hypothetical protein
LGGFTRELEVANEILVDDVVSDTVVVAGLVSVTESDEVEMDS